MEFRYSSILLGNQHAARPQKEDNMPRDQSEYERDVARNDSILEDIQMDRSYWRSHYIPMQLMLPAPVKETLTTDEGKP